MGRPSRVWEEGILLPQNIPFKVLKPICDDEQAQLHATYRLFPT